VGIQVLPQHSGENTTPEPLQQIAKSRYVEKSYWSKPVQGELKCNIDAAIFDQQGCYGVGMCIQNEGDLAKATIIRREATRIV